ncbi:hypothetical protein [Fulvimonas yonginensis]|uniref:DUF305 domain-containing protein n=1 Tax=Fulvimonas yonginensis TaxID=1495200 RepID=A0ABU8J8N9_9GAMM
MKTSTCLFALVLAAGFAAAAPAMTMPSSTPAAAVPAAPKLDAAMRALWHGHIVHTRDYALAVHAHDTARAKAAADAVVANAKQIADAVGGFYGKPAGEQMLTLLAGHWGGVKALTDARAAGDQAAQQKAMATLDSNAHAIAAFLAGANPNLPENAVQGLLAAHVAHHATQIQQIMSGDSKGEQSTWQAMQAHMDTVADALASAIAKQFPAKAG